MPGHVDSEDSAGFRGGPGSTVESTAVATDTFKLGTAAAMGILTTSSHAARHRRVSRRFGPDQENITSLRRHGEDPPSVARLGATIRNWRNEANPTPQTSWMQRPTDAVSHRHPGRFAGGSRKRYPAKPHRPQTPPHCENRANVVHIGDTNRHHASFRVAMARRVGVPVHGGVGDAPPPRPRDGFGACNLDHASRKWSDGNDPASREEHLPVVAASWTTTSCALAWCSTNAGPHVWTPPRTSRHVPQITIATSRYGLPGIFEIINGNNHSRERTRISAGAAVTT